MQPILWGKMLADLLQCAKRLGVLAALGLACGCSLNPQPLPPGETGDAATFGPGGGDATTAGNDSGGSFGGADAGAKLDATADGAPAVAPDAGAGDAGSDAIGDGPTDAVADGPEDDAPTDGGSEDGE